VATFDPPLRACPHCASADICPLDRDHRGVSIWRCRRCTVRFMNPQYTDAHLAAYYASYISDFERAASPEYQAPRRVAKAEHLAAVERHVAPGRLFSIGVGDGLELAVARERGWTVAGYDVDPATTERVARQLGITVHSGDLFALDLPAGGFDCVFMDQVLEHPKNPADYLRLVRRLLQPAGVLYLGLPNVGSLSSEWKRVLGKIGLGGTRGKFYATEHHLSYFTPRAAREVLRLHGFDVLELSGDPRPYGGPNPLRRLKQRLNRRFPVTDSSLRVLATPAAAVVAPADDAAGARTPARPARRRGN
jgi:SAM-dependent methyltransferase